MCSPAGSAGWGQEKNEKIRKAPPTHPSHMFFKVGFIGLDFNPTMAFGSYSGFDGVCFRWLQTGNIRL